MKRVNVAVGVIINKQQQILLAMRHAHLHQGNKWEFPGGKVENDETVSEALIRELKEEVGLNVNSTISFMDISHNYPDKQVFLQIHLVTDFSGLAIGLEGQQIRWVDKADLCQYEFPAANLPILEKLLNQS
ncbi:8-oxo-dGTP diphosphatase MutT [Shewanella donghaensis]|uniref:8-oxo-dGTP diphosphatase MutT n=1 Tax=Shewanella donghaensis TaxID=238836 RepID=UPI0011833F05|nr:8-oxo-dGTP diphosphatase MutT [Shewanella donghaensis]